MKCADDCFASGLVGVDQTDLLASTSAVCAGRGKAIFMDKPLIDSFLLFRFVNLTRAIIFVCYPFGGFQMKRKVFKVMMVEQL
jgi:hypothetical protein